LLSLVKRCFSSSFLFQKDQKKTIPIVVDKNYTFIRSLGIDPSFVKFFKEYKNLGSSAIDLNFGNISYYNTKKTLLTYTKNDVENDISALNLKEGITYGIIPLSVGFKNSPGTDYISPSEQRIITDKVNTSLFYDNLMTKIALARNRYSDEEVNHNLVYRLRPISMIKKIYESASNNQFNIDPEIKNLVPRKDGYDKKFFSEVAPLSYDLNKFGVKIDEKYVLNGVEMPGILFIYSHDIRLYVFDEKIAETNNIIRNITVLKYDQNSNVFNSLLEIVDIIDLNEPIFNRRINNSTLYIDSLKEIVINVEQSLVTNPLNKTKRDLMIDLNIASYDIETYIDTDGRFIPFACGWYTNKPKSKSSKESIVNMQLYYLSDFDNHDNMLLNSTMDLIKQNPGTVYVHNLSRFDSIFLSKILYANFNVNPHFKDNKILSLSITLKEGKKTFRMKLKDSLLLLTSSLRTLGDQFNVETLKTKFPHKFPNANNLKYIGNKPDISYYEDITLKEYENIPKNKLNLREETLKYLTADIKCLHQVIVKFAKDIFI